jgi:DNA-binding FadR family transcriptional regulator
MTANLPSTPARKVDVADDLERRILAGEFRPGDHLPSERELCSQYGVSRPVIREVLAGLVETGFIEVHPGRGSYVREVAVDDLSMSLTRAATRAGITARDLVFARVGLECSAVELAASQPSRPIEELRASLEAHDRATTVVSMAQTDLDFHEAVVAASRNPVLMLMFGAIRTQVFSLMLRSHSDTTVHEAGEPMHPLIVDALEKGDPERARALMRRHLELALELYGPDLDRPINEVVESRGLRVAAPLGGPRVVAERASARDPAPPPPSRA